MENIEEKLNKNEEKVKYNPFVYDALKDVIDTIQNEYYYNYKYRILFKGRYCETYKKDIKDLTGVIMVFFDIKIDEAELLSEAIVTNLIKNTYMIKKNPDIEIESDELVSDITKTMDLIFKYCKVKKIFDNPWMHIEQSINNK